MIESLTFRGIISSGIRRYSDLHIPGRDEISNVPDDWPQKFCKGSLNVNIHSDGYPATLINKNLHGNIKWLDSGIFEPLFSISRDKIGNNKLFRRNENDPPHRGNANVWRSRLLLLDKQIDFKCWVLRRIDSGLKDKLEIISDVHIREAYGLPVGRDYEAAVILYGRWL